VITKVGSRGVVIVVGTLLVVMLVLGVVVAAI
jgi:hypothetical protein